MFQWPMVFYLGVLALSLSVLILMVGTGFLFPHSRTISLTSADLDVSVLGSKIRYRMSECGSEDRNPVLVLLHGFGGSLDQWKDVYRNLSPRKTVALDLVGFGGSARPSLKYDLETHRRYLIAFLKELDIDEVILIGSSMGASIAAWTAARSKEQVVGLILIAPSGYPNSLSKPWPFSWLYRPGLSNRVASVVVHNPLFKWLFPNSLAPQAIGVTSSYDSHFAEALRHIDQPTLLAWSRGDKTALFKFHKAYTERIQNIEFLELDPLLGHSVQKKDPKGTVSFINNFINALLLD